MDALKRETLLSVHTKTPSVPCPHGYENWRMAVSFRAVQYSIRDSVNAVAFVRRLTESTGINRCTGHYIIEDEKGQAHEVLIFVHPNVTDEQLDELIDIINREGHLDFDAYWARVIPILNRRWGELSTEERLEYLERTDDPDDAVLATAVPDGVSTLLYQELDD